MRSTRPALALPAVLLAGLVFAACDVQVGEKGLSLDIARGKATDEWVRTYAVAPNGRVEIANANGAIEVVPAEGRDVEVRAEREARAHSDEAAGDLLQKVEMREDVARDRVRIEAAVPLDRGFAAFGRRGGISIRYRIRVPTGLTVAIKTQNGGIRVRGVTGRVEASSTNGGITVDSLAGSIAASAVNGGVRADLAAVAGDVTIASTNGAVRLDLPADVKAELDASWVNGSITIDPAFGIERGNPADRQLKAALNGGGPRISISTVNGPVRIRRRGVREMDVERTNRELRD